LIFFFKNRSANIGLGEFFVVGLFDEIEARYITLLLYLPLPPTENATRYCHLDGNWDNRSNYDQCIHLSEASAVPEFDTGIELPTIIYYTGYSISLIALTLAVIVFLYFK
jgi:hypothetical protein